MKKEIEEATPTGPTAIGGTHAGRIKKTYPNINKAGEGLQQRSGSQKAGNQQRTPGMYTEEATKKVLKKVMEKKKEMSLGKTATGQPGETITTEPTKPELVGYH